MLPSHAVDVVAVDAYAGEQEHETGAAAPPAHETPAPHAMQKLLVPLQLVTIPAGE